MDYIQSTQLRLPCQVAYCGKAFRDSWPQALCSEKGCVIAVDRERVAWLHKWLWPHLHIADNEAAKADIDRLVFLCQKRLQLSVRLEL